MKIIDVGNWRREFCEVHSKKDDDDGVALEPNEGLPIPKSSWDKHTSPPLCFQERQRKRMVDFDSHFPCFFYEAKTGSVAWVQLK